MIFKIVENNLDILYTGKCFQDIVTLKYEYSLEYASPDFLIPSCKYSKWK